MANVTSLMGRVAIITGGGSGIGAAIALEMSRNGALLCLTGRNQTALQKTATDCEKLSNAQNKPLTVEGDLRKKEVRKRIVDCTVQKYGRIDILVNNAGIMEFEDPTTDRLQKFDYIFDINFRAPYDLIHLVIPHLKSKQGCIINMSSIVSHRPDPLVTSYSVSKAALEQLTKCLAVELGPKGVRVLSINPAIITTDLWSFKGKTKEESEQIRDSLLYKHPLGRFGTPEEVGRIIAFMASDAAAYISGSPIMIDGGADAMP